MVNDIFICRNCHAKNRNPELHLTNDEKYLEWKCEYCKKPVLEPVDEIAKRVEKSLADMWRQD